MNGVFLVIFTLFWSLMVSAFDGLMVHNAFKQYESGDYPFVTGTITRSEVTVQHGSKGGISYGVNINYRYEVGGQTFTGTRLRYNNVSSSNESAANDIVNAHPVGATVKVYYNPGDPQESLLFNGIMGGDFILVLFLTPFNAVVIGLWLWTGGWLRERLFRPVAGGMKIFTDGMFTRVRLPRYGAAGWGLMTTGGLGFIAIFIVGFGTQMQPSFAIIFSTIALVYLGGAGVFLWQWQKIGSGLDDLVINEAGRSLDLPQTFGRKERVTVNITDVGGLTVEQIMHCNSKGGVSYTYAPTLLLRGTESGGQKLAEWSDKLKADDFAEWLRKQLGL
jgi:uncharacterized protein DUF3592